MRGPHVPKFQRLQSLFKPGNAICFSCFRDQSSVKASDKTFPPEIVELASLEEPQVGILDCFEGMIS